MLKKIHTFLKQNQMLEIKDKVVIGVSGGADSVCLFLVLLELRKDYDLELFVIHVHHGIRGREADRDESFVRAMMQSYEIPYQCVCVDVRKWAREKNLSVEEAGRLARYQAFDEKVRELGDGKIAVAHNENDQAETILFQLCRGSGLKGLSGMAPVRNNIIRPLLCVGRKEIEKYLEEKRIPYCEDTTNQGEYYTRNKIRHKILPYFVHEINDQTVSHIAETANMLRESQQYIEKKVEECFLGIVTEKDGQYFYEMEFFNKEDIIIKKGIIRKIIKNLSNHLRDIESGHIDQILDLSEKQVGKKVMLPYGIVGIREYLGVTIRLQQKGIFLKTENNTVIERKVTPPCNIIIKGIGIFNFELIDITYKKQEILKNDYTKWLDYDKIKNTIFIRSPKPEDFFIFGTKGHRKKLNRYFIDRKIPREERLLFLVLAEESHVIWVVGDRISDAYKIDENTKKILKVEFIDASKEEVQRE